MANAFVEYDQILMLLSPVDIASTVTNSAYLDLSTAHSCAFLVSFGAVTSTTATDTMVITVNSVTAENAGTEEAMSFYYRLSSVNTANTWGAITSCDTTGVTIDPAADDNKMVWIEIDPADIASQNDGAQWVNIRLTDTPDMEACLVSVHAFIRPRYKQTAFVSATASASA